MSLVCKNTFELYLMINFIICCFVNFTDKKLYLAAIENNGKILNQITGSHDDCEQVVRV